MTELVVFDREHARISPSGFERAEQCTASVRLSAYASPEAPGEAAVIGTAAHAVLEKALTEDLDTIELGDLRHVVVDGQEVPVDDGMLDGVQLCLDVVRDMLADREWVVEELLHLSFAEQYLGQPMYGYADVSTVDLPAVVVDYKHGYNPVDPSSLQLGLYVLAKVLSCTRGKLDGDGLAGMSVIVQPNVRDGKVKSHDWTYADLRDLRNRVIDTLRRIKRADWTYSYGPWCRWCPAAGICPHLAAVARDFALTQVAPTPEVVASGEITTGKLDEMYETVKVLDQFSRRFMETYQDYLIHGGSSRVAKLVRKRTARRWIDEQAVPATLENLGIDPYQRKLVTPAEAERRLPKGKRDAIASLTEKPVGELTIADADDPRGRVDVALTLKAALQSSVAAGYLSAAQSKSSSKVEGDHRG